MAGTSSVRLLHTDSNRYNAIPLTEDVKILKDILEEKNIYKTLQNVKGVYNTLRR